MLQIMAREWSGLRVKWRDARVLLAAGIAVYIAIFTAFLLAALSLLAGLRPSHRSIANVVRFG